MNRAETAKALAACEALAKELRAALNADARAEYAEQGCAPTWRLPGFTLSTALTRDTVQVVDEEAFTRWVAVAYPTEIYTVVRVRESWREAFLKRVAGLGDPPQDDDGTVVPGLKYVPGGEFRSVSVLPTADTKALYRQFAQEIVAGKRPLALPPTDSRDGA